MTTIEIIKLLLCIAFIIIDSYLIYNIIMINKIQKRGTTMYDNIYYTNVEIKNKLIIRTSMASCINIGLVIWFFML